jgi:hypothetical protein
MTLLHTKEGERLWVDQETYDLARDWAITAGRLTNLANTEAAQAAKTGDNAQF